MNRDHRRFSRPITTPRSMRRRGVALIAVLWIGVLAGLILVGVQHGAGVSLAVGHNELAAVQAHWLARAGVEQAVAVLSDDLRSDDSTLDLWWDNEAVFGNVEMATGVFSVIAPPQTPSELTTPRYGVIDLAGRVNVNDADRRQLEAIENVTPAMAASILDWRDRNQTARAGGAEGLYYSRLEFPYEVANRRLQTLDELRLVKDITTDVFSGDFDGEHGQPRAGLSAWVTVYSYETNFDAFGAARVNINRADATTLRTQFRFSDALARGVVQARRNQFDSVTDLLDVRPGQGGDQGSSQNQGQGRGQSQGRGRGGGQASAPAPGDDEAAPDSEAGEDEVATIDISWLADNIDRLTLNDDERQPARININTAAHEVLMTLPRMTANVADRIVAHRDSDAGPFRSVGDLYHARITDDALFRAIADKVTVRSSVFRIHSVGVSDTGVRQELVVVVDRDQDPIRYLYWWQSE